MLYDWVFILSNLKGIVRRKFSIINSRPPLPSTVYNYKIFCTGPKTTRQWIKKLLLKLHN